MKTLCNAQKGDLIMLIFATAAVNTQPDYIALAMVLALAVVVLVMALRKRAALKAPKKEVATVQPADHGPGPDRFHRRYCQRCSVRQADQFSVL